MSRRTKKFICFIPIANIAIMSVLWNEICYSGYDVEKPFEEPKKLGIVKRILLFVTLMLAVVTVVSMIILMMMKMLTEYWWIYIFLYPVYVAFSLIAYRDMNKMEEEGAKEQKLHQLPKKSLHYDD